MSPWVLSDYQLSSYWIKLGLEVEYIKWWLQNLDLNSGLSCELWLICTIVKDSLQNSVCFEKPQYHQHLTPIFPPNHTDKPPSAPVGLVVVLMEIFFSQISSSCLSFSHKSSWIRRIITISLHPHSSYPHSKSYHSGHFCITLLTNVSYVQPTFTRTLVWPLKSAIYYKQHWLLF